MIVLYSSVIYPIVKHKIHISEEFELDDVQIQKDANPSTGSSSAAWHQMAIPVLYPNFRYAKNPFNYPNDIHIEP